MLMQLSLTIIFALSFIACSQDGGQRTPINRAGSKTSNGNSLSKTSDVTSQSAEDKKKCLDIYKLTQRIKELDKESFRAYKSDVRILETSDLNHKTHSDLNLQSKMLFFLLQTNQESFYEVDYAKNIVKDVPSQLAPFAINKQNECKSVTAQFLGEDEPKELAIEQESFTDFYLVLTSPDGNEKYVFQRTGNDKLDFTSYTEVQLNIPECRTEVVENPLSDESQLNELQLNGLQSNQLKIRKPQPSGEIQTYYAKNTISYEWSYRDNRSLEVSTVLVNSFKDLLSYRTSDDELAQGIPVSVEKSLSDIKHSDTSRIKINSEDYIRMFRHALNSPNRYTNPPKCD